MIITHGDTSCVGRRTAHFCVLYPQRMRVWDYTNSGQWRPTTGCRTVYNLLCYTYTLGVIVWIFLIYFLSDISQSQIPRFTNEITIIIITLVIIIEYSDDLQKIRRRATAHLLRPLAQSWVVFLYCILSASPRLFQAMTVSHFLLNLIFQHFLSIWRTRFVLFLNSFRFFFNSKI